MFRRSLLCCTLVFIAGLTALSSLWPPAAAAAPHAAAHMASSSMAAAMLIPAFASGIVLALLGKLTPLLVSALVAPVMHAAQRFWTWYQSKMPTWAKPFLGAIAGIAFAQLYAATGIQVPAAPLDQWTANTFAGVIGGIVGFLMHFVHSSSDASSKSAQAS